MPHEKICDSATFFFLSQTWARVRILRGEEVKKKKEKRLMLLPNWNAQTFLRNGHRTQANELTLTGASTKNAEATPLYLMGSASALDSRYVPNKSEAVKQMHFLFSSFAWRVCGLQSVAWDVQVDQRCADLPFTQADCTGSSVTICSEEVLIYARGMACMFKTLAGASGGGGSGTTCPQQKLLLGTQRSLFMAVRCGSQL